MNNTEEHERKSHILLIEDNPLDIDLLRRAFRASNLACELTVLEDGAAALEFLRRCDTMEDGPPPDLCVLDLNLPKNDGIEVLQAMRATRGFDRVPVVILTSSASSRDRARIEQFGIARYITKPSDLDEYLKIGSTLREMVATLGNEP